MAKVSHFLVFASLFLLARGHQGHSHHGRGHGSKVLGLNLVKTTENQQILLDLARVLKGHVEVTLAGDFEVTDVSEVTAATRTISWLRNSPVVRSTSLEDGSHFLQRFREVCARFYEDGELKQWLRDSKFSLVLLPLFLQDGCVLNFFKDLGVPVVGIITR